MQAEILKTFSESDFNRVKALYAQLSPDKPAPKEETLRRMIEKGADFLCIKDSDNLIAMAFITYVPTLSNFVAEVNHVVVDETYRGKGLGTKIMNAVIARAKESGATRVTLTSQPSREAANVLYQKVGFTKVDTNFYRIKL